MDVNIPEEERKLIQASSGTDFEDVGEIKYRPGREQIENSARVVSSNVMIEMISSAFSRWTDHYFLLLLAAAHCPLSIIVTRLTGDRADGQPGKRAAERAGR